MANIVATPELIEKMQKDRDDGMTINAVAAKYSVGYNTVYMHTYAPGKPHTPKPKRKSRPYLEQMPKELAAEWDACRLAILDAAHKTEKRPEHERLVIPM